MFLVGVETESAARQSGWTIDIKYLIREKMYITMDPLDIRNMGNGGQDTSQHKSKWRDYRRRFNIVNTRKFGGSAKAVQVTIGLSNQKVHRTNIEREGNMVD
jgi:hypothetical protein